MIDLSNLAADDVESWKADEVTQALAKQLAELHRVYAEKLEMSAASGEEPGKVGGYAGRCLQLREILRSLRTAKGSE